MRAHVCRHPLCGALVSRPGYCAAHRDATDPARERERERQRYYSRNLRDPKSQAFYNSARWKGARHDKLTACPVCERCRREWARHVHHIRPLVQCSDAEQIDQRNLLSLCPGCHSVIEKWLDNNTPGDRYVVCGPPASGKSTWVESRRQPGDFVFDFDDVAAVTMRTPRYESVGEMIGAVESMREAVVDWLASHPTSGRVFVIIADPARAETIAMRLGATLKRIDATEADCLRRLETDPTRAAARPAQMRSVRDWFARHRETGVSL